MSVPTVDAAVEDPVGEQPTGPRRRVVLGLATLLALGTAVVVAALTGVLAGEPPRLPLSFGGDLQAFDSDWGNLDHFGVAGSWIVVYNHRDLVTAELVWDGEEIVDIALGEEEEHLITPTDVRTEDGVVYVDLVFGNCRYYHERELDIFTGADLIAADGSEHTVLFSKPIFVHSPMLHGCPDRTIDRGDDARGETYRR